MTQLLWRSSSKKKRMRVTSIMHNDLIVKRTYVPSDIRQARSDIKYNRNPLKVVLSSLGVDSRLARTISVNGMLIHRWQMKQQLLLLSSSGLQLNDAEMTWWWHYISTVRVEEKNNEWCTQMFAFWTTEGITFILRMYLK